MYRMEYVEYNTLDSWFCELFQGELYNKMMVSYFSNLGAVLVEKLAVLLLLQYKGTGNLPSW